MTKKKKKKKAQGAAVSTPVGGSNWQQLATKIGAGKNPKAKARREERAAAADAAADARGFARSPPESTAPKRPMPTGRNTALTDTIALDCEMVGVGEDGRRSIRARLGRQRDGNVVLDTFVAPTEHVTDYRTRVSGVRPVDPRGAPPFKEIQRKMADIPAAAYSSATPPRTTRCSS